MALFGNIPTRFGKAIAPLEARIDAVLSGMKPRDRLILGGVVGALLLGIFLGVGLTMRSSLADLRDSLDATKLKLTQSKLMAAQYGEDKVRLEDMETALNEHQGKDLSAFLEQAASKASAADSLTAVKPTSTTTLGALEQKNYTANLRKVTLEQALEFLYEAEARNYPLKIQSANIKVGRGKEKLLTLDFEVATFRLVEEEEVAQ